MTADLSSADPLRWGILGAGRIAGRFASDLALSSSAVLVAAGSRSAERAAKLAARHPGARAVTGYSALLADSDVEAVYVAVPHSLHAEVAAAALRAGKHVLVEKPFTLDREQAERLVATARAEARFLMEGMWTAFLPHVRAARELVASGRIGAVQMVRADFCRRTRYEPSDRLFDLALGGGALLDVGVYPIWLATSLLGRPSQVAAVSSPTPGGADGTTSVVLGYPDGAQAVLGASFVATLANAATIAGTEGRIEIAGPFYAPTSFDLVVGDEVVSSFEKAMPGMGLNLEAEEVAACVRGGRLESDVLPLQSSLEVMGVLDAVRDAIGLSYPR